MKCFDNYICLYGVGVGHADCFWSTRIQRIFFGAHGFSGFNGFFCGWGCFIFHTDIYGFIRIFLEHTDSADFFFFLRIGDFYHTDLYGFIRIFLEYTDSTDLGD